MALQDSNFNPLGTGFAKQEVEANAQSQTSIRAFRIGPPLNGAEHTQRTHMHTYAHVCTRMGVSTFTAGSQEPGSGESDRQENDIVSL